MMNLVSLVLTFVTTLVINLITMIKVLPWWEKALVMTLFCVPVPFTMEGYLLLKAVVVKYFNKKKGCIE